MSRRAEEREKGWERGQNSDFQRFTMFLVGLFYVLTSSTLSRTSTRHVLSPGCGSHQIFVGGQSFSELPLSDQPSGS